MIASDRLPVPVRRRLDWLPVWLIAPAAVLMSVLMFYPILRGVVLSFFNTRLLRYDEGRFIGVGNYVDLADDPYFWNSLTVTILYAAGSVVFTYAVGLLFALLLDRKMPGRGLLRMVVIMPWAIPEVVAVLIFVWMLDAQYGIINYALVEARIVDRPLAWLSQSGLALPAVILVTVWQQFPLAMLILLAGLQTIPAEQHEAAMVDGAGAVKRFRYVTLPGLRPVNVILVLILILNSFRRVTILYTMTAGGPARATETLSILTYNTAFEYQKIGYAAAVGTALLAILLVFSIVYFHVLNRRQAP
ncbi:MAG: sugar ABC transporter permease [Proteobacteria bacterium]|nr:sugar ABC transporter permease [Pseudomonadota bacterium]MBI3496437.1 sugar ABC transporter permease [Pseudomonadota bacterium]